MSHASEAKALDVAAGRDDLWSPTRIEALSDGVFAIVMTLLVLELKVPALPREASSEEIWRGFRELGPTFFSYFVTFTLAGVFWFWHHRAFHEVTHVNGPLFALNVAFLSFVSLLPFSTAMLGAFKLHQPVSMGCYFANLLAMALTLSLFWQYAQRSGLMAPPRDPGSRRQFTFIMVAQLLACVAALVTLTFNPGVAMNVYAFVLLGNSLAARRITRARR